MRVRRYNCKAMTASETPGQSARQTSRGRPRQTASARALAAAAPSAPQPPASLWEDTAASEPLLPDSAPQSAIRHYPFSHAIEELGYPIVPHEQMGRRIIEGGEVAAALERHGLAPSRVADLVDPPRGGELPPSDALLIRLLSGPLDVDKLDYLPRDARACNLPYRAADR